MKKILNEWRRFINEAGPDNSQVRINIAEKLSKFLFAPIDRDRAPDKYNESNPVEMLKKYWVLHWAIFGTKQERQMIRRGDTDGLRPIPDFQKGKEFADAKVDYFISKSSLTSEEQSVLKNDIPQLIDMISRGYVSEGRVQIPVELTGHENVDPAFSVPRFNQRDVGDWGLGGTIMTDGGESYILYVLGSIGEKVSSTKAVESLSDKELYHLYFLGEVMSDEIDKPAPKNKHFSSLAGMSYEDMVKMLKGN